MKTAVEWLENELVNSNLKMPLVAGLKVFGLIKKAKEMEKQQMREASCPYVGGWENDEFEYWYNEKFKKTEK